MNCILCQTSETFLRESATECTHCALVFKNPKNYYTHTKDVLRYSTHNNNHEDQGYIDFLNLLVNPLVPFLPIKFMALDFGCGPGPTLSLLLEKIGGVVENYDPIFFTNSKVLENTYDVVTCSEVVEHFKNIETDWALLTSLVKPGGILAIMTLFITEQINYKSWWYKNDPTHIVFYNEKTFVYLAERFNLEIVFNDKKSVIILRKK
ncbi:MAG: class I SAM-dependent methyltransferase [Bacteriovorax sp.]|nr:class I SAM-dependent methyltransferase [Bacteriovorax sp.]